MGTCAWVWSTQNGIYSYIMIFNYYLCMKSRFYSKVTTENSTDLAQFDLQISHGNYRFSLTRLQICSRLGWQLWYCGLLPESGNSCIARSFPGITLGQVILCVDSHGSVDYYHVEERESSILLSGLESIPDQVRDHSRNTLLPWVITLDKLYCLRKMKNALYLIPTILNHLLINVLSKSKKTHFHLYFISTSMHRGPF